MIGSVGLGRPARAEGPRRADPGRIFASWAEWKRAHDELVSALDDFASLGQEPIDTAERLGAVMAARDRVYRIAQGVEGYLYLRLQLDGADEEARSRQHLVDATDRQWQSEGSPWFNRVLTELGHARIARWVADEEGLRRYGFFFRRFFRAAEHPYPEGQDDLRALSSIFERQSARVYQALATTETPVVEVVLESGERLELTPARARSVLGELPSALDRKAVSGAWLEALGRRSQTYAALLEGIVERQQLLARVRGFDSALAAQLHADAIPADAIRGAIRVAREGSAPLRRYHELRKRTLGLDEYGLQDRFTALDPGGREIGFDEARRLIIESASALGPEAQGLVTRAFSDGWIDSVERPGKRPHGGSTFVAGAPYVLVNYRGSLDSLFQLAHEIGHAVHAQLAHDAQPFIYSHRSSLTSEAVAGVFEGALVARMVGQPTSRKEKIGVLDLAIQNTLRLFYRPMLDADFELRLYEADGPLTGPSLAARYLAVAREFYGNTVRLDERDGHAWQQTPHYYTSPLYMGRYGLASAAATTMTSRLTSPSAAERAAARQALLELMRSGASDYPIELLKRAGADLGDSAVSRAPVTRLAALVADLERTLSGD